MYTGPERRQNYLKLLPKVEDLVNYVNQIRFIECLPPSFFEKLVLLSAEEQLIVEDQIRKHG